MKVAVIGLASSSFEAAPWDDPTWQKWGLPWGMRWIQLDRAFEMHDLGLLRRPESRRPKGYEERLQLIPDLYMQEAYFPNAKRYPFEEVIETTGDYFNSSISYLIALAIHEGAETIGLWGVDMDAEEEYGYQRPNCEYLIGLARGMGINVVIPDVSPLCKFNGHEIPLGDMKPTYPRRYGCLT